MLMRTIYHHFTAKHIYKQAMESPVTIYKAHSQLSIYDETCSVMGLGSPWQSIA